MTVRDILQAIPVVQQRQDGAREQLADLRMVANRLGMWDAADAIRQIFETDGFARLQYGCHLDLEPGQKPDGCVIDVGMLHQCIHAKAGMRKEQCEYWRVCGETSDDS